MDKETNEFPLLYFTRSQSEKLRSKMGNDNIIVDFAMRYGNPSINSKLNSLKSLGCEHNNFTFISTIRSDHSNCL